MWIMLFSSRPFLVVVSDKQASRIRLVWHESQLPDQARAPLSKHLKIQLNCLCFWVYWVVWPVKWCFTVTLPSEHFMQINGELFQSPELVLCRTFLQNGNAEYPRWGLPNPALGFLGKTSLKHLQWAQQLMWTRENQCQYDLRSLAWSYGQQTKCKRICEQYEFCVT